MRKEIIELKINHDLAGPEMSKFILNANSAVKEGDPKKLKFIASGVIPVIESYHSVIDELFKEIERLETTTESEYTALNDDHKALLQIIDRALKLAFLTVKEEEDHPRFKMDANGNLTRIQDQ